MMFVARLLVASLAMHLVAPYTPHTQGGVARRAQISMSSSPNGARARDGAAMAARITTRRAKVLERRRASDAGEAAVVPRDDGAAAMTASAEKRKKETTAPAAPEEYKEPAVPAAAVATPLSLGRDDNAAWLAACQETGVVSWYDVGLRLTGVLLEPPPVLEESAPAAVRDDDDSIMTAQECCDAMNLNHGNTLARVASARNQIALADIESVRALPIDESHLLIEAVTVDGPYANMHAVPLDVPDECLLMGRGISTSCLVESFAIELSAHGSVTAGGGASFCAGDRVNVRYRGGERTYPGVIARRDERDGSYAIDYDDGEREEGVPAKLIEARKMEVSQVWNDVWNG